MYDVCGRPGLCLGRSRSWQLPCFLQRWLELPFVLQQLLPELLLELLQLVLPVVLQQLLPELLLELLRTCFLLPACFVLPARDLLPADDLLRAGHDLQLRACHELRADLQHLLPADDDLQLQHLPADLQLRSVLQLPNLQLQQLLVLAFVLQLVQLLALLPQLMQLRLQALSCARNWPRQSAAGGTCLKWPVPSGGLLSQIKRRGIFPAAFLLRAKYFLPLRQN
jgi:hypothetical protein